LNALGYHLLLELKECDRQLLDDPGRLEHLLVEAANRAGATVVQKAFHQFNPHGVSGVVIIAESHLFIHTWPEHGYAAVDIFTCGDTVRADKAAEWLAQQMGTTNFTMIELRRGVMPGVLAVAP